MFTVQFGALYSGATLQFPPLEMPFRRDRDAPEDFLVKAREALPIACYEVGVPEPCVERHKSEVVFHMPFDLLDGLLYYLRDALKVFGNLGSQGVLQMCSLKVEDEESDFAPLFNREGFDCGFDLIDSHAGLLE